MLLSDDKRNNCLMNLLSSTKTVYFVVFVFFLFLFGVRYGDYLYVTRNYSFFPLFKSEFLNIVSEPGGALELMAILLAGTFETPWIGALILSVLAWLISRLIFSLWRDRDGGPCYTRFTLSLLPSFFIAALYLGVGLNVFESNHGTFYLEPFPGILTTLLCLVFCRTFEDKIARFIVAYTLTFLLYPLVGVYSLLFLVLFLIEEFKRVVIVCCFFKLSSFLFWGVVGLGLFTAFLPLIWGRIAWPAYDAQRLYRAAFVEETVVSIDPITLLGQKTLFCALCGILTIGECVSLASIFSLNKKKNNLNRNVKEETFVTEKTKSSKNILKERDAKRKDKRIRKIEQKVQTDFVNVSDEKTFDYKHKLVKRLHPIFSSYAVVVLAGLGLLTISPHDENFMAAAAMMKPLYETDWKRVIEIESNVKEPSEATIMFRRLAHFYNNDFAEHLFERPEEDKTILNSARCYVSPQRICASLILDLWGFPNLAARTAVNNYVATRGRSIPAIKSMIYAAYACNEQAYAERYLYRMEHSLSSVDRSFRDSCAKYLDEEYRDEFRILPAEDYIETELATIDLLVRNGLSRRSDLAKFDVYDRDRLALFETRLSYALLYADFDTFANELGAYQKAIKGKELPKAFQEAVLFLEHINALEKGKFPVDPKIKSRFEDFSKFIELYRATNDPKLLEGIRVEYGNTAWFHFIFKDTTRRNDEK